VSTEVDLKQTQWQKLSRYVLGNQAAWIADIALKAGLFRAIADAGGTTEEALAQRLDYNLRCAKRFPDGQVVGLEFDAPSLALARQTIAEAGFANVRVADQPLPTRFIMLAEADGAMGASEHSGG
jgi:hypothetical protein